MVRHILRPLHAGMTLNLRNPVGRDWRLGSIRKHKAIDFAEDSRGILWRLHCISWSAGVIYEVKQQAEPEDGWDAKNWYEEKHGE